MEVQTKVFFATGERQFRIKVQPLCPRHLQYINGGWTGLETGTDMILNRRTNQIRVMGKQLGL